MPTVVRNSVPADLTSSALRSQTRMIADAGDDLFSWLFPAHYGLGPELNPLWFVPIHAAGLPHSWP